MEIIKAKTADLIPYGFNNRIHSDQQVDRIANSINQFGFNQPIVVDENNIILVGHGRFEAAKKLNLEEVPVLKKTNLSETEKKAYRILDNKLQNDSTWNTGNLELELASLEELGFEIQEYGLSDLTAMFSGSPSDGAEGRGAVETSASYESQYAVTVICTDEEHQRSVYDRLIEQGLNCRVVVT